MRSARGVDGRLSVGYRRAVALDGNGCHGALSRLGETRDGEPMSDDDDFAMYSDARQRRIKAVAWVVILSLILVGGGATVLSLLFG
ncbi:hypothetical protein FBY40_0473 [Microbacterium sp. SLBN-154]|nr:hypothetical protein FBY40_0473 [Microbacterium sp. SLBN-154]